MVTEVHQRAEGSRRNAWASGDGRVLHSRVKEKIGKALGDRSWKWPAMQIGVPQSTLASQASKPKFSLEVVGRIACVLDLDLNELLGLPNRKSDSR